MQIYPYNMKTVLLDKLDNNEINTIRKMPFRPKVQNIFDVFKTDFK